MARIKNTTDTMIDVPFSLPDSPRVVLRCKVAPDATSDEIPDVLADHLCNVLGCTIVEGASLAERREAAKKAVAEAKSALADAKGKLAKAAKDAKDAAPGDESEAKSKLEAAEAAVAAATSALAEADAVAVSLKG